MIKATICMKGHDKSDSGRYLIIEIPHFCFSHTVLCINCMIQDLLNACKRKTPSMDKSSSPDDDH